MPDLTYKDRLIIKAHERINRLKSDRMGMIPRSTQWVAKTSQIDFEKGYINDLRENSIHIENHSNRENANGKLNKSILEG